MASMIAIRDLLALHGRMGCADISRQLNASPRLIGAMLERMEIMGKVVRVVALTDGCHSGSCRSCPEGQRCGSEQWALMS